MRAFLLLLLTLSLAACTTPARIGLPDSDTLEAGHRATLTLADLPPPQELIYPGDTLRIVRNSGETPTISAFTANSIYELTLYTVLNDGTFSYPFIGKVQAGGKTPEQLAADLEERLAPFYREPGVTVNINQAPGNTVFVGGSVRNPQSYSASIATTLEQAIVAAGGVEPNADSRHVALLRSDPNGRYLTYFVDYSQLLYGGELGRHSVALQRGDVVFVPKSGVGNRIEGVDLYLNQLIPFVKSIGIGANYDIRRN
ncbi:polysaccharide export protein [Pseudomonas chengduensis]|uniref:Polysaccharide export protein n=1 Tax=Ectopseudomonas oleovorans TaxID=301 RepID=A0A3R8XIR4_ECTOL|nr:MULTISPECIES: polysaccharide biosynthesis/export family protein [Pseudomonas]MDH1213528.1 polysaccharide export protein [Pseudomonas chengduensis]RRW37628.1 polysaccharide export protein [Pseudomonas oleovorans]